MTDNQVIKLAKKHGLDIKLVTKWTPPDDGDERPLITMPNIPAPMHTMCPRNVIPAGEWNKMRRECYAAADDTCEICGYKPDDLHKRHSHEAYALDYEAGTMTFVRCVCLCANCHLAGIHTGRAITLYSQNNPMVTKKFLLDGAEHAFQIISEYNKEHPDNEIRAYKTFVQYLRHEELAEPILELIKKYNIKFYIEDPKKTAKWGEWKMIYDGEEYPTPFKNRKAWEKAMEQRKYNSDFLRAPNLKVVDMTQEDVKKEHDKLKGF